MGQNGPLPLLLQVEVGRAGIYNFKNMKAKRYSTSKQSLVELCREKGINPTPKRKVILEILENTPGHPDVDTVYRMAKKKDPALGQATVYRTLRLMRESGVIRGHSFGQDHTHFESPTKQHHDHLICDRCGKIEEFVSNDLEKMQEKVAKSHKFEMISHRLDIHGICLVCAAKEKRKIGRK